MKFIDTKEGLKFAVNGSLLKKTDIEDIIIEHITEWGVFGDEEKEITIMVWSANDNCHLHMINDTL